MSGAGRIVIFGMLLAAAGTAAVRAQTVLGDPRDAAKTFAANCSACHKSPRGLAKSGQVAGFLRQHYTTGPEMSAAMAAYLVSAGSAPEAKKGPVAADAAAAKAKSKKGEQLAAQHPQAEGAEAAKQHTLRGKQRQAKAHEEPPPAPHATQAPQPTASAAAQPAAEKQQPAADKQQTAALGNDVAAPAAAPNGAEPPMVLDIPMPELPAGPPSDLVQSLFSSSPLP